MIHCEEKKTATNKESTLAATLAAIIALATSTGLLSWFGIFSGEHSNRGQGPLNVPATHQFINKDTRNKVVDLRRDWKLQLGDDSSWAAADYDDSSWGTIPVPSNWDSHGLDDYDGFAWYRTSFRIEEEDAEKALFLYLGRIDDVDEVFINGARVDGRGRAAPDYLTAWNQNRIYRIDTDVLKPDSDNVIAVRVYDDQLGGGIVEGPVGVFSSDLPQPLLDLAGEWQFCRGDNASWAHESGEGFSSIQVPLIWEAGGIEDYDGFAWYQKRFSNIQTSGAEKLALVLGKIDDTDQAFLNGTMIGSTGELDGHDRERNGSFWRMNRVYEFYADLLRDDNLLAIRVHDSGGGGGIYSGPVGIMTVEDVYAGEEIAEQARGMSWGEVWDWLLGRDRD